MQRSNRPWPRPTRVPRTATPTRAGWCTAPSTVRSGRASATLRLVAAAARLMIHYGGLTAVVADTLVIVYDATRENALTRVVSVGEPTISLVGIDLITVEARIVVSSNGYVSQIRRSG